MYDVATACGSHSYEESMNILIAYTTKSETTKECAKRLSTLFSNHTVELVDLSTTAPDLSAYDLIAIGAPVRYGRIDKRAARFVKQNEETLKTKKYGLFCCCGFPDAAEDCFARSYSNEILNTSLMNVAFGGVMDPARVHGLDRLVTKMVLRSIESNNRNEDRDRDIPLPAVLPENIRAFADTLRESLG